MVKLACALCVLCVSVSQLYHKYPMGPFQVRFESKNIFLS